MTDVWLKIPDRGQAINALRSLGLDVEMIRDRGGQPEFVVASHDVAIKVIDNLLVTRATHDRDGNELTPAVFDGPHLMVRFVSEPAKTKARAKLFDGEDGEGRPVFKTLPAGLELVPAPGTIVWA